MGLKDIGKELSKLASIEMEGHIKRGQLILEAKDYFNNSEEWIAWSTSFLGTAKAMHYRYIQLYKAFNDGTFGREMKVIPLRILQHFFSNIELRKKAQIDMKNGICIDSDWLNENKKKFT